jgi:hypothetical protein
MYSNGWTGTCVTFAALALSTETNHLSHKLYIVTSCMHEPACDWVVQDETLSTKQDPRIFIGDWVVQDETLTTEQDPRIFIGYLAQTESNAI